MEDISFWKDKLDREIDEIRKKLESISGSNKDISCLKDVQDNLMNTKNTSLSSLRSEIRLINDRKQRLNFQKEYTEYENSIQNMLENVNHMLMTSEPLDETDAIKAGDSLLSETENLQKKTQTSLSKTRDMINEAKDVGMTTVKQLKSQRDQLQNVQDTVTSTEENLLKSDKLMKRFWRGSSKVKKEDQHQYNKAPGTMTKTGTSPLKVGSQFKELQTSVIDRLRNIHILSEEEQKNKSRSFMASRGDNSKNAAIRHSKLRIDLERAFDELEEMNKLYLLETKKKRSRYSAEELADQKRLLEKLSVQLKKVKDTQKGNFGVAVSLEVGEDSSVSPLAMLSDEQSDRLKKIDQQDKEFDRQLDDIEEGISDLLDVAEMQNLEVDTQNQTLQTLEADTENMQSHMTHVNAKMKRTLMRITGKRF